MIAATIHDPQVFTTLAHGGAAERATLMNHLAHVAHSHVHVLDRDNHLGCALLAACQGMPATIQKRIEMAFGSQRVVRVQNNPVRERQLNEILNRKETAVALSLPAAGVDAIITDDDGKACVGLGDQLVPDNLYTLPEFLLSDTQQRLHETMGNVSTGGMHQSEFSRLILKPILRWTKQVRIIDRYIGSALYDYDPDTHDADTQWGRVSSTLKFIYSLWEGAHEKRDTFIIITQPYPAFKWGRKAWHRARWPSEDEQAQALAERLDLGREMEIRMIKVPDALRDIEHDRYLLTNRNITLNFSRGFDLIRPNGTLIESAVSLCQENANGAILTLLNEARTLSTCRMGKDGWTTHAP